MTARLAAALVLLAFAGAGAGCSEKPQTATTRKTDGKPWQGAQNGYVAAGWKAGDAASWDLQIRNRSQAQNEYARATAAAASQP